MRNKIKGIKIITFVIIIIHLPCCSNQRKDEMQKYVYFEPSIKVREDINPITFDVLNLEYTDFYENIDSIKLIKLETNDESLIGNISRQFIVSDTLFVVDYHKTKSIFAFDLNGNYLYKISKFGLGPGEYQNINMIHIDNISITIMDWLSQKIIKYDLEGNLLFEKRIESNPNDFIETNNGEMIFAFGRYNLKTPYQIVFTNIDWDAKETAFPFKINSHIVHDNISSFQKTEDDKILYHYTFCDTIYQIKGKEITAKYNLALYDTSKMNAFYKETKDMNIKDYNNKIMKSDIVGYYMFLELDNVFYINFSRGMKIYASIVYKDNYITYNSIAGDAEKKIAYNPFYVNGYYQNALLTYIDESFFSVLSEKNRELFYSHFIDKKNIEIIKELKDTDNNPVVCILYIKKHR